jgi:hypothetical protein
MACIFRRSPIRSFSFLANLNLETALAEAALPSSLAAAGVESTERRLAIPALRNPWFEGGSIMSENTERPPSEVTPPATSLPPASAGPNPPDDPREALLRGIEKTRLPPELLEQILAELPPEEERERMYRDLMENGGLSFEDFFESLLAEFEEQS